jgi:tetratricopeptide (TPR) repeat protein
MTNRTAGVLALVLFLLGGGCARVGAVRESTSARPEAAVGSPSPGRGWEGGIASARTDADAARLLEEVLGGTAGRLAAFCAPDSLFPVLSPLLAGTSLRDLVVVLPTENPMSPAMGEEILSFLEDGRVAAGDRGAFRQEEGAFVGRIGGTAVSFRPLASLPRFEEARSLLVDPLFFQELYRNEVKTPMVGIVRKWGATLVEKGLASRPVVLLDEPERADFPLELGWLPRMLREVHASPSSFADSLPGKWATFAEAERMRYFEQSRQAAELYESYLEGDPSDPSAYLLLARLAARDGDVTEARRRIDQASSIDRAYRRGYGELAAFLLGKSEEERAVEALEGGLSRFPADPGLSTFLAGTLLQRGERKAAAGDANGARRDFEAVSRLAGADPALAARARELLGTDSPPVPPAAPGKGPPPGVID